MQVSEAQLRKLILEVIRKVKGGWKVYPKKPQKGEKRRRALSKKPHKTYKAALAQLRAVERSKALSEGDPPRGTGKKPKGSGRRLYTDEDPSDTVSVSFKNVSAIKKTLAKSSFKSKSHKRQSQIINLIHQRARSAYRNAKDPKTKARLKKAYEYAKSRKEASKAKTQRIKKNK